MDANKTTAATIALVIGSLFFSKMSFAVHSTIEDATQLKNRIIYQQSPIHELENPIKKSIVLPVSRGFDQQKTCLCWSYAFFNALETLYLSRHPGESLELSRGTMQFLNLEDRINLKITGAEDHLDPGKYKNCWAEGGTPLSAAYIMNQSGALPYNNYHDVISPPDYANMYYRIFADGTTSAQQKATSDSLLPAYFGYNIPTRTYFNKQWLSRSDFVKQIMPEGKWTTYAISKNNKDYTGPGLDPDARRSEQTHFVSKKKFLKKMNRSLENGHPIIYSNDHHVILIYGADYNDKNEIVRFYIKDSYERLGYFYKSDFKKTMDELMEITLSE